tara:strand:+ start:432 stop:581 length:150 start_codon:yes stop_codon:yes gene_type:complete
MKRSNLGYKGYMPKRENTKKDYFFSFPAFLRLFCPNKKLFIGKISLILE